MENTKQNLSLDFTRPRQPRGGGQQIPSLATPNLGPILNLSTPELSKLIQDDGDLAVLTPNGISSVIPQSNILPSPLIPTTVNNNNIINNSAGNNDTTTTTNGHNANKRRSDKSSDLDIEKIEKKRERNRLAAKKCRQRKLETIDELRKTVTEWEQKYQRLEMEFERFKNIRNKEVEQLSAQYSELKSLVRQ